MSFVRMEMFYNGWGCIIAPFFGVLYNHCYALGEIETKKKGEGENFRVPKTKYNYQKWMLVTKKKHCMVLLKG